MLMTHVKTYSCFLRFINAFHCANNIFKDYQARFQEDVWAHPVLNESRYKNALLGVISLAFSSVLKYRTDH